MFQCKPTGGGLTDFEVVTLSCYALTFHAQQMYIRNMGVKLGGLAGPVHL